MEHAMTLVIFTFLSQMAIGAFACLFFIDTYKEKISERSTVISLITILAISAVAVVVSVFHLGHPFAAYRALLNFGASWLTREIVFFPLFMFFVLLYTFFAKTKAQKQILGWTTVVFGAVTIFSTAMIYTIPSVPAWNNGTTLAAFFLTALLPGPILVQLLLALLEKRTVNFNLYTTVVAFLALLLNGVTVSVLKSGLPAAVESAGLLTASPLFWIKIATLAAAFALAGYFLLKKKAGTVSTVATLFALVIVAEFLGRILFYSSGVHL